MFFPGSLFRKRQFAKITKKKGLQKRYRQIRGIFNSVCTDQVEIKELNRKQFPVFEQYAGIGNIFCQAVADIFLQAKAG